jgi:hypothetical protein
MENKNKDKQTNLPKMETVASVQIDTSKYVGLKSKISKLTFETGNYSPFLKVTSDVLGQENDKDVVASMIFSLKETKDGLAIPEKGNLKKFMNSKKVEDYRELIGKDIIILSEADDKGIDWLIFN